MADLVFPRMFLAFFSHFLARFSQFFCETSRKNARSRIFSRGLAIFWETSQKMRDLAKNARSRISRIFCETLHLVRCLGQKLRDAPK